MSQPTPPGAGVDPGGALRDAFDMLEQSTSQTGPPITTATPHSLQPEHMFAFSGGAASPAARPGMPSASYGRDSMGPQLQEADGGSWGYGPRGMQTSFIPNDFDLSNLLPSRPLDGLHDVYGRTLEEVEQSCKASMETMAINTTKRAIVPLHQTVERMVRVVQDQNSRLENLANRLTSLATLQAETTEVVKGLTALRAPSGCATPQLDRARRIPSLEEAIHTTSFRLMGISQAAKVKLDPDDERPATYPLPEPLPPGSVQHQVNHGFISAVAETVFQNRNTEFSIPDDISMDRIVKASKGYFVNLVRGYKEHHTPEGIEKGTKRRKRSRRHVRPPEKANARRCCIRPFRSKHGREQTRGVAKLIWSDWQSGEVTAGSESEGSDSNDDEVALAAREARRAAAADLREKGALYVVEVGWLSDKLRALYASLDAVGPAKEGVDYGVLSDTDEENMGGDELGNGDESEDNRDEPVTLGKRRAAQAAVQLPRRSTGKLTGSSKTMPRRERVRGIKVSNDLPRMAKASQKYLYKECMGEKWAMESPGDRMNLYVGLALRPAEFTVFDMVVQEDGRLAAPPQSDM
ncbi:uncharacterized protein BXZ73DRAFT_107807 [Epithele typhae]|uniref:uncharacterized protein n=1 Tax=Epithele typhae TaxID=378194 RepID=UPI0020072511|nr:uncharacterized protein BXZ73DRAFT_107807 [Epithele typhae]KAH9911793.1 hypothetical protein BXZ73DRAFT_107807 [Epithele typhae]